MFGPHFYNERVRKSVAVFGAMFNNLYVNRKAGGGTHSQMKVPIAYAPQRKFLERIQEMYDGEDAERQLAIRLPRMSFEVTNIQYDPARQLPKMNNFYRDGIIDTLKNNKFYVATPYIITFELNIYGKTHDDCLQCVEQIIPYFNPQYTVAVKPLKDFDDVVEDVPVILQSTVFSDDFEGGLENRRTIIYTMTFDMKVAFWGPKRESNLITRIDVDMWHMDPLYYLESLRVETDPRPVSRDSDHTIVSDIFNKADQSYAFDTINPQFSIPVTESGGTLSGSETIDLSSFDVFDPARAIYSILDSGGVAGDLYITENQQLQIDLNDFPTEGTIEYMVTNSLGGQVTNTVTVRATPSNFESVLINAVLVEAARFMKAEQDVVQLYQSQFNDSILLLKNLGDGKNRMDAYRDGQVRNPVK